jgi:hypothetical protein
MSCLSSIKYSMIATINRNYNENVNDDETSSDTNYETVYDPVTGYERIVNVASDFLPGNQTSGPNEQIPCLVSANINIQTNNQTNYGAKVWDTETLTMKVPARYRLYTTDRVTEIISRTGELLYVDDQVPNATRPAVYNVVGSTPINDPFGRTVEHHVLLKKVNS